ncbi:hypothetical protein S7711_03275 [Stachybotrys chartarum IBT 7711]|uniref:Alpha/beta hydrolase fold-3 domain-containing protein n=1 Tax=Stachybotrys chartarum (strain CBS 109288 / IBT 7711) TaxID=1280523 RepID=A0A084AZQ1_STACB|nr:hypothetical protein S7711_03275 [Stachybotrys chartarum IBT 7711]KFA50956.1 hypothetical protein S40293_02445 [Stachybotrys chartarum IBT 40293]
MTDSMSSSKPSSMSRVTMLWIALSKIPLAAEVALKHTLGLSELSRYLDLRSELVVTILRSILQPSQPRPISLVQSMSIRDPGVKGKLWISKYTAPAPPEPSARDAVVAAVKAMQDPSVPEPRLRVPELAAVEAEWTGYRAAASPGEPLPDIPELDKYHSMNMECSRPTTILYFHGGAYYLCDPSSHRGLTAKLAKLTGGRCYSVRYRLAPQHPFPAALVDALVSYMTLLYPPPDAFHEPVRPEHIVFSGDSAGGNMALALLQLVLQLRRDESTAGIMWHGQLRPVPLPAGVACGSPWCDLTQSDPRWEEDTPTPFDYLPKPAAVRRAGAPKDDIWPASPPRSYLYADDDLIANPLASVVAAPSWKGAPPVYVCTGWEILSPEGQFVARAMADQGVPVVYEEYEAMPHCWFMLLDKTPSARRCFERWASFIKSVVEASEAEGAHAPSSSAVLIKAKSLHETPLRFEGLSETTQEAMRERVIRKVEQTVREAKL